MHDQLQGVSRQRQQDEGGDRPRPGRLDSAQSLCGGAVEPGRHTAKTSSVTNAAEAASKPAWRLATKNRNKRISELRTALFQFQHRQSRSITIQSSCIDV